MPPKDAESTQVLSDFQRAALPIVLFLLFHGIGSRTIDGDYCPDAHSVSFSEEEKALVNFPRGRESRPRSVFSEATP